MSFNTQYVYTEPAEMISLRNQLVTHLRVQKAIQSSRVLSAMGRVPRQRFVNSEFAHSAYEDRPLPIARNQTISQPFIVATTAELLELRGAERVLEIGAGSGYQAAVLSLLAGQVVGLEWHRELAISAQAALDDLGIENAEVYWADGKQNWGDAGTWDRIAVACACREVPLAWCEALKPGGILVFPQERGKDGVQHLVRWTKSKDGQLNWSEQRDIFAVRFVPLL